MNASVSARYPNAAIVMHWLTVILIVAVYVLMEFREFYPKGSAIREAMKSWHYTLGLTVFLLTLLRLGNRVATNRPPIVPPPPA
jgi:superoxide oxidase